MITGKRSTLHRMSINLTCFRDTRHGGDEQLRLLKLHYGTSEPDTSGLCDRTVASRACFLRCYTLCDAYEHLEYSLPGENE